MLGITIAVVVLLLSVSTPSSAHIAKICTEYSIPVTPTSTNLIWPFPAFRDNYDVVNLLTSIVMREAPTPAFKAVSQTANYTISATICSPKDVLKSNGIVMICSHGLGFDRSYWDPNLHTGNYSFVDHAIGLGYSTFCYDRLGVGKSTLVSGYVNQATIQAAILTELTTKIKKGSYTGSVGTPKKVVLVGHSFGSIISASVASSTPTLIDGVVLTGFSNNASGTNGGNFLESFALRIANGQSSKWKALDSGYVAPVDVYSNVNGFFKAPDYDIEVAEYVYRNRAPFGISEAVTGSAVNTSPVNFTGVAMLISGQFDFFACTGQCDDLLEHPSKEVFSKAKAFKAVSYPGAGHGLNLHKNASGAYKIITDFLMDNGL